MSDTSKNIMVEEIPNTADPDLDPVYCAPNEFSKVFDAEKRRIAEAPEGFPPEKGDDLYGLVISGGGIRSASFALGVMQALKRSGVLKVMDYLSTVSGGGYIGSSLTWWLSQRGEDGKPLYGLGENHLFPFGQKYKGNRVVGSEDPNAILDFIRQHGNYLVPGKGVDAASLGAMTLRAMFVSLLVYFAWLVLAMLFLLVFVIGVTSLTSLGVAEWFNNPSLAFVVGSTDVEDQAFALLFFALVVLLVGLFVVFSLWSSLATLYHGQGKSKKRYRNRIRVQKVFGWVLTLVFCFLLIGLLPILNENLTSLAQKVMAVALPTGVGGGLGVLQYRKEQSADKPDSPLSALIPVLGAFLLLFGLALGAYALSRGIIEAYQAESTTLAIVSVVVLVVLAGFFGFFVNLNGYIHRMYRDRLMETFLPNRENVKSNRWGKATEANEALIETMCQPPNVRPYHLVSTNIVLVDSSESKFRGRGGDSFVLSPLYCGSDATGWCRSDKYMKKRSKGNSGGMTLATAMAISGAAANPNTGLSGRGLTRNRLVSTLMSLLNLRLGYWAPHPDYDKSWPYVPGSLRSAFTRLAPNFIFPGFRGGVLNGGLHEDRQYIELTDGGHFENLALYELIRRKLKLIIVCDGGADPNFFFGDLANAVERVKVDFGVKIRFEHEKYDLGGLQPRSAGKGRQVKKYNLAKRGFAIGSIYYPDAPPGTLLYLKTTLTPGLPPDIYGYKSANPTFPDQTTADQFFDEAQFEAYRELGYQLGKQLLKVNKEEKWIPLPPAPPHPSSATQKSP